MPSGGFFTEDLSLRHCPGNARLTTGKLLAFRLNPLGDNRTAHAGATNPGEAAVYNECRLGYQADYERYSPSVGDARSGQWKGVVLGYSRNQPFL
jgi:hypothetical protein